LVKITFLPYSACAASVHEPGGEAVPYAPATRSSHLLTSECNRYAVDEWGPFSPVTGIDPLGGSLRLVVPVIPTPPGVRFARSLPVTERSRKDQWQRSRRAQLPVNVSLLPKGSMTSINRVLSFQGVLPRPGFMYL